MSHLDYGNWFDLCFLHFVSIKCASYPVKKYVRLSPFLLKTPQDFLITFKSKGQVLSKAWKALCNYCLISSPILIPATLLLAHPISHIDSLLFFKTCHIYSHLSASESSPDTCSVACLVLNTWWLSWVTRYQAHLALPSPTHTSYFSCFVFRTIFITFLYT